MREKRKSSVRRITGLVVALGAAAVVALGIGSAAQPAAAEQPVTVAAGSQPDLPPWDRMA